MTQVYQGEIQFRRFLDEQGTPVAELPGWATQPETLQSYYRNMVLARQLDTKIIALQRTGQMGTYPSMLGAEAIDAVSGELMQQDDVLVPYYRNHSLQIIRGAEILDILNYWGGDERGSASPGYGEDFPNAVPIATQSLHATGVATAFKIRGEKRVAVTFCGDGATSKGDFMEALNLAGAWQLPVVFFVNNNQWAISVPRSIQCGAETLAQKGLGAGIRCEQIDGNDVIAIHEAMADALKHARDGKGATLIEAISYRLSDHTTADDATRYRHNDELKAAWQKEPVKRLQNYLVANGWWDEVQEQAWLNEVQQIIQDQVDTYLNMDTQPVESIFDYLYAELPKALQEQRTSATIKAMTGGSHHES